MLATTPKAEGEIGHRGGDRNDTQEMHSGEEHEFEGTKNPAMGFYSSRCSSEINADYKVKIYKSNINISI
jgi:hypothetical protein